MSLLEPILKIAILYLDLVIYFASLNAINKSIEQNDNCGATTLEEK